MQKKQHQWDVFGSLNPRAIEPEWAPAAATSWPKSQLHNFSVEMFRKKNPNIALTYIKTK